MVTRQAFLTAHPDQDDQLGAARYVVIDGNRRLGAARIAGLDTLRIDVNDALASSAADIIESAMVANIHREDLTPLEEAEALATLVKVHGSQRQVARRVGKTHVWVSQRLALLDLTPELQDSLRTGDITVEDARQVARLPQAEQAAGASERKDRKDRAAAKSASTTPPAENKSDGGNGVSTVRPDRRPEEIKDTTHAPGPGRRRSSGSEGGNGVSTAGPSGQDEARELTLDFTDLPALGEVLRRNLDIDQRQALANLLIS